MRVRRDGAIVQGDPRLRRTADFGAGARRTVGVPWGDVSTAWRSTGIRDIEVFFEATRDIEAMSRLPAVARRLLAHGPILRFLQGQVDRRLPPGPTDEERASGRATILAEAWDATGQHVAPC